MYCIMDPFDTNNSSSNWSLAPTLMMHAVGVEFPITYSLIQAMKPGSLGSDLPVSKF